MRFLALALSIFLATLAFADRPVPSARMGKVGSLHPNSWRMSQALDKEGEGVFYTFNVYISYAGKLCDSFSFSLNEGSKNTKKSQFSLQGDLEKEFFGSEVSMEIKSITKDKATLIFELSTKILDSILFINDKHSAVFSSAQIDNNIELNLNSPLVFNFGKDANDEISVKIEMSK